MFFTIVVYILAFYLLFLKEKEENLDVKMSLPARIIAGIVSGFISAPMGRRSSYECSDFKIFWLPN